MVMKGFIEKAARGSRQKEHWYKNSKETSVPECRGTEKGYSKKYGQKGANSTPYKADNPLSVSDSIRPAGGYCINSGKSCTWLQSEYMREVAGSGNTSKGEPRDFAD